MPRKPTGNLTQYQNSLNNTTTSLRPVLRFAPWDHTISRPDLEEKQLKSTKVGV